MTMATIKMMTKGIHSTRKQMMQKISTRAVRLISRKTNFPLRASLSVRNQMSSLRGRHQSMEKTSPTQNASSGSHSIQKVQ